MLWLKKKGNIAIEIVNCFSMFLTKFLWQMKKMTKTWFHAANKKGRVTKSILHYYITPN